MVPRNRSTFSSRRKPREKDSTKAQDLGKEKRGGATKLKKGDVVRILNTLDGLFSFQGPGLVAGTARVKDSGGRGKGRVITVPTISLRCMSI